MLGFIHHIISYFIPYRNQISGTHSQQVAVYDLNGNLLGYTQSQVPHQEALAAPPKVTGISSIQNANHTLYTRTSDGRFIQISPRPPPIQNYGKPLPPLPPLPAPPPSHLKPLPTATPKPPLPEIWNGWPDGFLELDFTRDEYTATKNLLTHWVAKRNGGYIGNPQADSWIEGLRKTRKCHGVIICQNSNCSIAIRPPTDKQALAKKILHKCRCGGDLFKMNCGIFEVIWEWKDGVHYQHKGLHTHPRPSQVLHLLPHEQAQFDDVVKRHPKTGPLGLIVGIPELGGPGESVAAISPVLYNADRVSKERAKLKKAHPGTGGDAFLKDYTEFCKKNAGFVIFSVMGEVTVICLQTPLMRKELCKDAFEEGNTNGMVNDGAHGWWRDRTAILMVTSVYCRILHCWIPGVFSYMNGATVEHFKLHFRAVFQSIAHEAEARSIEVVDQLFAGMMDFSDAERQGFIQAFTEFWSLRLGNTRTVDELKAAAMTILKGCQEHFRAGVTRVSRISAAVDPSMAPSFIARALALLDAPDSQEFISRAALVVSEFPKLKSWMDWWTRPVHAAMLFPSERKMDVKLWESLPDTNNAEEAMHWKLYAACGRDHDVLEGLASLHAVAVHYEMLYNAVEKGQKVGYGEREHWKVTAALTGHSKDSRITDPSVKKRKRNDGRAPDTREEVLKKPAKRQRTRKTNDGRPPDTTKALKLKKPQKKGKKLPRKPKQPSPSSSDSNTTFIGASDNDESSDDFPESPTRQVLEFGPQSYRWLRNSCWLDVMLELIYIALSTGGLEEFLALCMSLPKDSAMRTLLTVLNARHQLMQSSKSQEDIARALIFHRDNMRTDLRKRRIIRPIGNFESVWVFISELVRLDSQKDSESCRRVIQYFQTLMFDIHECSGNPTIGGRHVEINGIPRRRVGLQVGDQFRRLYAGNMSAYLHEYFSITKQPVDRPGCWRVREGVCWCSGHRRDINDLVISVPVILTIEVAKPEADDDDEDPKIPLWNFPPTITPLSEAAAQDHGIIYDLVGYVVLTSNNTHFTAKYISGSGGDRKVYTYDSMQHQGRPIRLDVDDLHSDVKPGDSIHQALYYLRGGVQAQDMFVKLRSEQLTKIHPLDVTNTDLRSGIHIAYTAEDLKAMDPKTRSWMTNPYRSHTSEYIPISEPQEPASPVNAIIESEDEDSEEALAVKAVVESKDEASPEQASAVKAFVEPKEEEPIGGTMDVDDETPVMKAEVNESASTSMDIDNEPPITHLSPPAMSGSEDSLPDSAFSITCRCGASGDGNLQYDVQDVGEAIQCDQCKDWSHIACQRDGRASNLREEDTFLCDACDLSSHPAFKSRRKSKFKVPNTNRPLTERLTHGDFWYPVRLIHTDDGNDWRVKWWIGCTFQKAGVEPGSITTVSISNLTDSLWKDRLGRRKIRLGRWRHAGEMPTPEDILGLLPNAPPVAFTSDIDRILSPAYATLKALLINPEKTGKKTIPAKKWLQERKQPLATAVVPLTASLTMEERAMITDWFEKKICNGDQTLRTQWLGRLPIAHAYTVFIADRIKTEGGIALTEKQLLTKAFKAQRKGTAKDLFVDVDIDKECLEKLEKLMFERSARAGVAGNYQWGLDVGGHDGWDPYGGIAFHWTHEDRPEVKEGDLDPGPDFVHMPPQAPQLPTTPRPQPRPRGRPRKITKDDKTAATAVLMLEGKK